MKKLKLLPHLIAIIVFCILSYSYFSPLLEGKEIVGGDDVTAAAQQKAITDYYQEYNKWPRWADNLFSGMPATFVYAPTDGNLISPYSGKIHRLFGTHPASTLILMLLGFFFLLRVLRVDPWLSIAGSIGYGFTTFFFILIPTGHYTQMMAFVYIAPLIAAVIIAFRYNRLLGVSLVSITASFELGSTHPQMSFYAFIFLAIYGIVYLIDAIRKKTWKKYLISSVIIVLSGIFALGTYMDNMYPQYQYQKLSIRGASELTTETENDTEVNEIKSSSGLDYDYATAWSYGIDETFNILIPNLKGGGGPDYWGKQPFTAGPMYIGAVLLFLFVLAMFLLKGPIRWWLLVSTLLAIVLSWGSNSVVYDFFFYHVPFFNKFRNPVWALVIAMISIPLGATLGLQKIIDKGFVIDVVKKQVIYSAVIVGGICLLFWISPGLAGNFEKEYISQSGKIIPESQVNAQNYARQSGTQLNQQLITTFKAVQVDLIQKRKDLLKKDALRSLILILLAFILVYLFIIQKKFKKGYFILFIGALILFDLWGINERFVNKDDFSRKKRKRQEVIQPYFVNNFIINAEKNNRNYRVLDLTQPLTEDSHTLYFHPSLGGYNAAKLRRYQDLMDYHLNREYNTLRANLQNYNSVLANSPVINMLNTKYIIYNNDAPPLINTNSLGVGWLVDNIKWADNANEEIEGLTNLNPEATVVVNSKFRDVISHDYNNGTSDKGTVKVTSYKMDDIFYEIDALGNSIAVFPEIYHTDWHAYIDGKEVPVIQCNYVLRGIEVPKGNHKVEFRYIPTEFIIGSAISYISSFIIIGFILIFILLKLYKERHLIIKKWVSVFNKSLNTKSN